MPKITRHEHDLRVTLQRAGNNGSEITSMDFFREEQVSLTSIRDRFHFVCYCKRWNDRLLHGQVFLGNSNTCSFLRNSKFSFIQYNK